MMDKLKHIDLSYSSLLESTPDFTSTPNLKELILHECKNLKVVHQSLGALESLVRIDLKGCENLETFPNSIHSKSLQIFKLSGCKKLQNFPEIPVIMEYLSDLDLSETGIRELPSSIEHLPNLECLLLTGCKNFASLPGTICNLKRLSLLYLRGCSKLQNFPEIPVIMEHLNDLNLSGTGIRDLPSSIEHLPNLGSLSLIGCKNFASLPGTFCNFKRLRNLNLCGCSKLDKLPEELGNLECLDVLKLEGTGIKEVPSSIEHISSLEKLYLSYCKNLRSLPSAICKLKCLKRLNLCGCSELEKLPKELGSLESLEWLYLDGTAITQLPDSFQSLNNLTNLDFSRSSQSRTSILQFLPTRKRKRQEDDSTWSLVFPFISDLSSLLYLCLASCNMLDGAIPSDPESCSLVSLDLGGNCFVQLPSLNQLSKLRTLCLDGCKMLEALPELPSSIKFLSADDCPSLRLSVDRITDRINLYDVSFRNCLQLFREYNGESKNEAISTLWQHMIEAQRGPSFSCILPGGDIPKWFVKPTTGHSISLELPSNWSPDNFVGVGLCVAFEPRYKAPFKYVARREKVDLEDVHVEINGVPVDNLYFKNISMENMRLKYVSFADLWWWPGRRTDMNDGCEMEVSIKNSSPNIARVTKWGMGLVPNIKQYDDDDRP